MHCVYRPEPAARHRNIAIAPQGSYMMLPADFCYLRQKLIIIQISSKGKSCSDAMAIQSVKPLTYLIQIPFSTDGIVSSLIAVDADLQSFQVKPF